MNLLSNDTTVDHPAAAAATCRVLQPKHMTGLSPVVQKVSSGIGREWLLVAGSSTDGCEINPKNSGNDGPQQPEATLCGLLLHWTKKHGLLPTMPQQQHG